MDNSEKDSHQTGVYVPIHFNFLLLELLQYVADRRDCRFGSCTHFNSSGSPIHFYSFGSRHSFLFIQIPPFIFIHPDPAIFIHSDPAIHFYSSGSGSECKFGSVCMAIFVISYSYLILACLMPQRKLQHLGLPQLQLLNK